MAETRQTIKKIIYQYIYNLEALGISVHKVIIFGSQAKGTFTEDSDIDIAVISNEFEMTGLWERTKYLGRMQEASHILLKQLVSHPPNLRSPSRGL